MAIKPGSQTSKNVPVMDRKKFIATTGLLGLSSALGVPKLFGQQAEPGKKSKPMKEKVVLKGEGQKLNIIGDHQQIKLAGKDTNGQFLAIYQDNPPNTQIPMHVHQNEDEVYKVLEGEVEFTVGDRKSVLKSGDTIFLPRNIPHNWKVIGTINAKVYLDVFPAGLENMFEELNKLPAGPPDFPKVAAICGRFGIQFV